MGFYDAIRVGASGAADTGFTIDRSVRISRDSGNYFSINNSSSGNTQTFTFSFWMKLGKIFNNFLPIYSHYLTGSSRCGIVHTGTSSSSAGFQYQNRQGGSHKALIDPAEKLRDHSAWYHVVFRMDTTNSTQADRFIIYVNGRRIEFSSGSIFVVQNSTSVLNSATTHYIGHDGFSGTGDFYLADIHLIDGQALDASHFAETDATTGQWIPKEYTGSYSGTSYHLKFDDNSSASALGTDSSGLGNDVTPVNFSVAAGLGNDSMKDTPTNNFATFNAAFEIASSASYANGNLEFSTSSTGQKLARSTFAHDSGKWYAEFRLDSYSFGSGSYPYIGVTPANKVDPAGDHNTWVGYIGTAVNTAGTAYKNGSVISGGFSYAAGDIIGMAMDVDNLLVYFYKNGTIQNSGSGYALTSDSDKGYQFAVSLYASSGTWAANFGAIGIGSNSDANGHGNFTYSVPSGYLAECSANLPDPTILLPNKHFDTLLYTGNGGTQSITGLDFQPDWGWFKSRSSGGYHDMYDSVRGGSARLIPNSTTSEASYSNLIQSFNSDGYTLGTASEINGSSLSLVAWNWNAGNTDGKTYTVKVVSDGGNKYRFDDFGTSAVTLDLAEGGTYIFDQSDSSNDGHPLRFSTTSNGTHGGGSEYTTGVTTSGTPGYSGAFTQIVVAASAPTLYYYCTNHSGMGGQANTNSTLGSSNFDGSIQTTVKASPIAGFSIMTYTGTGSAGTCGHGLGVVPDTIITKSRNASGEWTIYNKDLDNASSTSHRVIRFNAIYQSGSSHLYYGNDPTSTVQHQAAYQDLNQSGETYVAYCFSSVSQFSKFGKYKGNGSSSDGTFIFLGFRPAFFMVKNITGNENWYIYDNKRNTFNVVDKELNPNNSQSEATFTTVDFLSNGLKIRTNNSAFNSNNVTYIYYCFAEAPFKNARAR